MLKIYVAIKAHYLDLNSKLIQGHLTLAFMNIKETKSLSFSYASLNSLLEVKVATIEYWKDADVTVAVINSEPKLDFIKKQLENSGFTYSDYEYIPHITLSKGDLSESYQYLLNTEVFLTHTYMKIKDF